jgi:hypothetical protein
LVRGSTGDANTDYKMTNNADFKISSSVSGTDTDRLVISSSGNVGIGTQPHTTYKLDVNGDVNISTGSSFRIGGDLLSTFTPSSTNLIGSFLNTQFENVGGVIQYKTGGISYNNLTNKLTSLTGGNITINGTNEISSAMFAPSSTNLIGSFLNTQFENVGGVIQYKTGGISYNNLTNKLTALPGGNITISGTNEISATTFTPSSANLIGVHNSAQFEQASSLISIKTIWKLTTAGTSDTANALTSGTSISTYNIIRINNNK